MQTETNTAAKGNAFESQIYQLICDLLSRDQFFVKRECCKVFRKKGYYSRDRGKNIIFDVSVEVVLPEEDNYSLLVLVECKNYGSPVPVDDVEEFFTKVQQISGANVKGIVAATSSFQEGAFAFSRSKGIGLLRYFDAFNFKWVLPRTSPSALVSHRYARDEWNYAWKGLSQEHYASQRFDCCGYSAGRYTVSINLFLRSLVFDHADNEFAGLIRNVVNEVSQPRSQVPHREEEDLEEVAFNFLERTGYSGGRVSLDSVCEAPITEQGLELKYVSLPDTGERGTLILGTIHFSPLCITVYESPDISRERQRFTLAHELGHLLLGHQEFLSSEYCETDDIEVEKSPDLGIKDIVRMEWQANYFASCLLLPKRYFLEDFYRIADSLDIRDRGFGFIFLDGQRVNRDAYFNVSGPLMRDYGVSRTAVKLRLKRLGLLNEASA